MNVALTVAGSDSGGGAGIQADIKTFSAFNVFGTSVITAVTAQNTMSVSMVHELPLDMIAAQLDAVLTDFEVGGTKTGMLSSARIIEVVAAKLREYGVRMLVVDPVMVAKSGDRLLREDAVEAMRREILPLALVVTPNVPEAEVLTGISIHSEPDREEAARRLHAMGAQWVVVKGGHLPGDPVDLVSDGRRVEHLHAARVDTTSTHGTGCTFSAAIAAMLARGADVERAISEAKTFVTGAIGHAEPLGHGHGPLKHFYRQEAEESSRER